MHLGAWEWLKEFLEGATLDRYAVQAAEHLALLDEDVPTEGGSEYMQSDGLNE